MPLSWSSSSPRTRRRSVVVAERAAFAVSVMAALVLVVPIVLWAQFGDGDPLRTLEVTLGAAILCWAVAHRGQQPAEAPTPPPSGPPRVHGTPPPCRHELRQAESLPRHARNVSCHAARRPRDRRPARRRTRP